MSWQKRCEEDAEPGWSPVRFSVQFKSSVLAAVCNKCGSYLSLSHRNQKCHESAPPQLQTILCSVWASLVLCDSNPFRPVLSPCSEGRGSLGNACRACQCFLYCPGLAQELGSCSPPGRRMLKAEQMVLKPSFVNSGTLSKLLLLFNQLPTCDINGYEILAALW